MSAVLQSKKQKQTKSHPGFTLLEILIVVAIIGLIASVVVAAVNNANKNKEEVHLIQTHQQVQKALELYSLDNNGEYPLPGGYCTMASSRFGGTESCWETLAQTLSPYASNIPLSISNDAGWWIIYEGPNNVQNIPTNVMGYQGFNCINTKNGFLLWTQFNDFNQVTNNWPFNGSYTTYGGNAKFSQMSIRSCERF